MRVDSESSPRGEPMTYSSLLMTWSSMWSAGVGRGGVRGVEGRDEAGDLVGVGSEGEVAGVEQVQLGVGKVGEVGPGALGDEELVVGAPGDERGRAVLA